MAAKYSLLPLGSGFIDLSPGFHPAGQTSSGLSWTYWRALARKNGVITQSVMVQYSHFQNTKNFWATTGQEIPHLKSSQSLINTSANGQVVNGGVLNDSLSVNDEKSSQGNSLHSLQYMNWRKWERQLLDISNSCATPFSRKRIYLSINENVELGADFLGDIRDQGVLQVSKSS